VKKEPARWTSASAFSDLMRRPTHIFKKRGRRRQGYSEYRQTANKAFEEAVKRQQGSHGPASAVKKIDPKTSEVVEVIPKRS